MLLKSRYGHTRTVELYRGGGQMMYVRGVWTDPSTGIETFAIVDAGSVEVVR